MALEFEVHIAFLFAYRNYVASSKPKTIFKTWSPMGDVLARKVLVW